MELVIRIPNDASPSIIKRASTLLETFGTGRIIDFREVRRPQTVYYYIDALRELASDGIWGRKYILDTGDDQASLIQVRTGSSVNRLSHILMQEHLYRNALGVVIRGLGHAGLISRRVKEKKSVFLLADFPTMELHLRRRQIRVPGARITVGFLGSSNLSRTAPPSGWHLLEAAERDPKLFVRLLVSGSGLEKLQAKAKALPFASQALVSDAFGSASEFLDSCDAFFLPQSANRIGQVRTTGKLLDYLQLGRPIFTSAVGTAGAILPPEMLIPPLPLASKEYSHALSGLISRWQELPENSWQVSCAEIGKIGELVDSYRRLDLWKDTIKMWASQA